MTLATWLLFCLTKTALCIFPGPAALLVLSTALRRGFPSATRATAGILAGNILYFALSATGIAAVILASHAVFSALKWAGAAYLVWLGLLMLLSRGPGHDAVTPRSPENPDRLFGRAFIVQAANSKALVFFIALLPQFINPAASVPWQILVLAISSAAIQFTVLSLSAAVAARPRSMAGAQVSGAVERIGGVALIAVGARLAWYRAG